MFLSDRPAHPWSRRTSPKKDAPRCLARSMARGHALRNNDVSTDLSSANQIKTPTRRMRMGVHVCRGAGKLFRKTSAFDFSLARRMTLSSRPCPFRSRVFRQNYCSGSKPISLVGTLGARVQRCQRFVLDRREVKTAHSPACIRYAHSRL
jgi:hypothetical protein